MKIIAYQYFLCVMSLVLMLSGCGSRVTGWWKKTFDQGEKVSVPIEVVRRQIKTLRLYKEFTTRGIFDVLWLSDGVRRTYAQMYAHKHGFSDAAFRAFENEQLALNTHHLVFYVLAYQQQPPAKIKILNANDSWWSAYVEFAGQMYQPSAICVVDLPVEYRILFGKRFNRYQTYYQVTFAVPNARELVSRGNALHITLSAAQRKGTLVFG